jgi:hypothetical protein
MPSTKGHGQVESRVFGASRAKNRPAGRPIRMVSIGVQRSRPTLSPMWSIEPGRHPGTKNAAWSASAGV